MSNRKRMPSLTREAFQIFYSLSCVLGHMEKHFEPIVRRVPNGWRDFRLAQVVLDRLVGRILETIPPDQLRTIVEQVRISEIRYVTKRADNIATDQWVMDRADLAFLANKAIETTCIACDGSCKNQCKLRRIVDDLPVDITGVGGVAMACKGGFDI